MSEKPFTLLDDYARQLDLEADQIAPASSPAEVRRLGKGRRTRRGFILLVVVLVGALGVGGVLVSTLTSRRAAPVWATTATGSPSATPAPTTTPPDWATCGTGGTAAWSLQGPGNGTTITVTRCGNDLTVSSPNSEPSVYPIVTVTPYGAEGSADGWRVTVGDARTDTGFTIWQGSTPSIEVPVSDRWVGAPSAPESLSTSTTSTSTSAGVVVTLPGGGIALKSADDINAVTWLSPAAKTFLVGELATSQHGVSPCFLTISAYRVPDLIAGGYSGWCGGAGVTWGDFSGTWKTIIATQDVPLCADIRATGWTSSIPRDFPGGQCFDDTMAVVDYTP